MSVVFRSATPSELLRLLPYLDQQFVYDKHRSLSLAVRFPSTFCIANSKNIFICVEDGAIVSALAIKFFEWQQDGRVWNGAMLGAVYTNPAHRRQGRASQLLNWVAETLEKNKVDFAVLWTTQPEFYARLGWISSDIGVLGEIAGRTTSSKSGEYGDIKEIGDIDPHKIEETRRRQLSARIIRQAQDYLQIPTPAKTIEVAWSEGEHQTLAYALLGVADDTGIVYEMVGDEQCMNALFSQVYVRFTRILFNDCKGSESHDWLTQHTEIIWQDKPLAMWLILSDELNMKHIKPWYIPYFDRI